MTIAPKRDGTLKMIEQESRSENPVRFMISHSMASCRQAQEGLKAGARGFTHLYIVMSRHGHRDPGFVTAAFLDDVCFCELIVDGFHVHPDIIRATWKALGPDRIVLITETMPGKGMPDGEYLFFGLRCVK